MATQQRESDRPEENEGQRELTLAQRHAKARREMKRQEKERLQAESRRLEEWQLLEAEREKTNKAERSSEEHETRPLAAEQQKKQRQKERLEAERLEAERQRRLADSVKARKERERLESAHGESKGNIPPSSQDFAPAQAETPSVVESEDSTNREPSARYVALLGSFMLVSVIGFLWFGCHAQ